MQSMCISVGTYVESKKEGADPRRTSMYPPRTSVNDPDPHRPRRRTSVPALGHRLAPSMLYTRHDSQNFFFPGLLIERPEKQDYLKIGHVSCRVPATHQINLENSIVMKGRERFTYYDYVSKREKDRRETWVILREDYRWRKR